MANRNRNRTPALDPNFLSQAQAVAQLRYTPQLQQLALLRSSRRSDYLNSNRQAELAARMIAAGNQEAGGGLASFLSRINGMQQQIGGPQQGEAAIVANNLGLSSQAAGALLANNTSRAYQGAVYQRQKLRSDYLNDKAQIDQQASNLSDLYGLDVQNQYNSLVSANNAAADKARESRLNRRNQRLVAGYTNDGTLTPGAQQKLNAKSSTQRKKDAAKNAPKWLTPQQQNRVISDIQTVASFVKRDLNRVLGADLTLPDGTVVKKGQKLTTTVMRSLLATKKNPLGRSFDHDVINSAFDIALRGALSAPNVKALHNKRVKIKGRLPTLASQGAGGAINSAVTAISNIHFGN